MVDRATEDHDGGFRSRTKDLSKTKCYWCDKLGHLVRDCSQLRDQTRATATSTSSESEGDVLEISDEVSTSFQ